MAAVLTRNKEGVISVWQAQGSPVWAIYEGNKPLFCCGDDGIKKRLEMLEYYLKLMEESFTDQKFEIRFYDQANKNGKVNNSDPFFGSLPFKVGESEKSMEMLNSRQSGGASNMNGNTAIMMQLFEAKMDNLDLKWQHMMEKKDEEIAVLEEALAEEPEGYADDGMGKIGAITNMVGAAGEKFPWMQDIFKNLSTTLNSLVNVARTKYSNATEPAGQMNGIPNKPDDVKNLDQMLSWAGKTLIQVYREKGGVKFNEQGNVAPGAENEAAMNTADTIYVMDMVKLAEIAASKPNTFDNVVKSLREM